MKINIFDICGTMYDSNTTFDFLDYMFLENKRYQIMRKMSKIIFFKIVNKIIFQAFNIDLFRIVFLRYLKGMTRKELENKVNDFYKKVLEFKKIDDVILLLNKIKKEDKKIILVSATIDIIAQRIAKEFSLDFISSKLSFDKEICLGTLEYDLLGKKDSYIKEDIELVVTDNISDLNLIRVSKKSVIISKKKNIKFWNEQKLCNYRIMEV